MTFSAKQAIAEAYLISRLWSVEGHKRQTLLCFAEIAFHTTLDVSLTNSRLCDHWL